MNKISLFKKLIVGIDIPFFTNTFTISDAEISYDTDLLIAVNIYVDHPRSYTLVNSVDMMPDRIYIRRYLRRIAAILGIEIYNINIRCHR